MTLVTILSTLFSFENYLIRIISSHIIIIKKIVKDYLVNEALFSLFITSYIHPSLTCLHKASFATSKTQTSRRWHETQL